MNQEPPSPDRQARMAAYQKTQSEQQARDWPNLGHYRSDNAAVLASGKRPQVVLLGDSITENWHPADPSFFDVGTLDRGISGQTTPQICCASMRTSSRFGLAWSISWPVRTTSPATPVRPVRRRSSTISVP